MTSSWKSFFGIIWDDNFISEVKLKLCLIFQNFQNGRHFELATNFFTGSYTGRRIYQKDSHEHIGHFELLIDAVMQIMTEIYQFQKFDLFCDLVTSSMTSWICIHIIVVIIWWYICTGSLMMISLLVVQLSWKMLLFHSYRNIEGRLWGHLVTSSMTSSSWKSFFWHNLGRSFHIWGQIEPVFNISKFSKWPLFWARDKIFTESYTGSGID